MSGISKCANGTHCELKDNCLRYLSDSSDYQSYFDAPNPGLNCDYYIPDSLEYMKPFKPRYCEPANTNR